MPLIHRSLTFICKIQGSTPSVQKQRKFAVEAIDKIVYARVMQIRIL